MKPSVFLTTAQELTVKTLFMAMIMTCPIVLAGCLSHARHAHVSPVAVSDQGTIVDERLRLAGVHLAETLNDVFTKLP